MHSGLMETASPLSSLNLIIPALRDGATVSVDNMLFTVFFL